MELISLRVLVWALWKANLEQKPRRKRLRQGPPRDPRYMAWIRTLPCAVCGSRWRVEAAHTGCDGGMSQKASDYSCVPLCRYCHTGGRGAYHRIGKLEFERSYGIDLLALVRALNFGWEEREANAGGEPVWRQ
jgi:hypothetical protein